MRRCKGCWLLTEVKHLWLESTEEGLLVRRNGELLRRNILNKYTFYFHITTHILLQRVSIKLQQNKLLNDGGFSCYQFDQNEKEEKEDQGLSSEKEVVQSSRSENLCFDVGNLSFGEKAWRFYLQSFRLLRLQLFATWKKSKISNQLLLNAFML